MDNYFSSHSDERSRFDGDRNTDGNSAGSTELHSSHQSAGPVMSTLYLPGDSPAPWQNRTAGTVNEPWAADMQADPTFLPVSDYEAGRRDGIMLGLVLGALSASIIMVLIGLIIW